MKPDTEITTLLADKKSDKRRERQEKRANNSLIIGRSTYFCPIKDPPPDAAARKGGIFNG